MNFIVGRLLQFMTEEESFWTLANLIETVLPIDYYSNMVGVLIDQQVFKASVHFFFRDLYSRFEEVNFDPSLLAFQWFVCIFTLNINEQLSMKIWDLFMIKGIKALFCTGLALIDHIQPQLMEAGDLASIFMLFDEAQKSQEMMTPGFFSKIAHFYSKISNDYIAKMRERLRSSVEEEL